MTVILDEFTDTETVLSTDARGRITLGPIATSKRYMVSRNAVGQLLLTPAVVVPEYEAWLYQNPKALAMVQQGLAEAAAGKMTEPQDFSQSADIEIDD